MRIGIAKETAEYERRVAATPASVKKLVKEGHSVAVARGAGEAAEYFDEAYVEAGATLVDDVFSESDVVFVVQMPEESALKSMRKGALLMGLLDPYRNTQIDTLISSSITALALELLPRQLSRAQNMDALSSQANLAGYKAVILAANQYPHPLPMFMTSAGTVKPAKVVVLGVGVAGLQAIATAKRLGAVVEASDLRPSAAEQAQSVGAKWLDVPMSEEEQAKAKDSGGYGWKPSEQYIKDQAAVVDKAVRAADIVITTAQVPGGQAPKLVHAETVAAMRAGSVLVDMAVTSGGNVVGSEVGQTVRTDNGAYIIGETNIPATLATQASALYANNLVNVLSTLVDEDGKLKIDLEDEIQHALTITHAGERLLAQR
ncbi:Re/Si-specific NAD(P)(+) transhydrogenase subunit alpha [Suttonella sp. R2A3]|uniref:Re/Si-specific NAD(P)(+) transhydrogenase subunit alpha n=1 Tax=Suttonella sp. R2A3 TaxID=2908648 RepID=UPI001F263F8A|nr:Re/Si-specific NAD(P)(+) transhydrogenase subunit alpha [Suttonella sp. R2A3]UJF24032.1 Re/Si-specific NAD(P)(+) transhydrogenase subunit alpha [Suttonella sp. R2A3]